MRSQSPQRAAGRVAHFQGFACSCEGRGFTGAPGAIFCRLPTMIRSPSPRALDDADEVPVGRPECENRRISALSSGPTTKTCLPIWLEPSAACGAMRAFGSSLMCSRTRTYCPGSKAKSGLAIVTPSGDRTRRLVNHVVEKGQFSLAKRTRGAGQRNLRLHLACGALASVISASSDSLGLNEGHRSDQARRAC